MAKKLFTFEKQNKYIQSEYKTTFSTQSCINMQWVFTASLLEVQQLKGQCEASTMSDKQVCAPRIKALLFNQLVMLITRLRVAVGVCKNVAQSMH